VSRGRAPHHPPSRRAEGRPAEAAELVALLNAHAATDQSVRTAACELREELVLALPPAELEAAEGRGSSALLADEVARLRESAPAAEPQPA